MLSQLDQRATLEAKLLTPDGGGGYSEAWQSVARIWVKITPLAWRESFGPDRLESRARHRLTLKRRSDLAIGQRLVVGPRRFAIHSIEDGGPRQNTITLLCEEVP